MKKPKKVLWIVFDEYGDLCEECTSKAEARISKEWLDNYKLVDHQIFKYSREDQ